MHASTASAGSRDIVIEPLVEGRVGIDVAALPDARFVKRGPVKRALNRFDRQLWPLRRPRRFAIQSLEWLRSRSPHLGGLVDRLQTPLLTTNYRLLFFDREGKRRPVLPVDEIIAGDLVLDQAQRSSPPGPTGIPRTRSPSAISRPSSGFAMRWFAST
jgi:hypothetical protein